MSFKGKAFFRKLDPRIFDGTKKHLIGIATKKGAFGSEVVLDAQSADARNQWIMALRSCNLIEKDPSRVETVMDGYVTQRYDIVGVDSWQVRYAVLEKLMEPLEEGSEKESIFLKFYTNHSKEYCMSTTVLDTKTSACMTVDRDCFDMGRRKFLLACQKVGDVSTGESVKKGSSKIVFDVTSPQVKNAWISAFTNTGIKMLGNCLPKKRNTHSIKEGWISKQGGKLGTWRVRYAVLTRGCITYYGAKLDKSPKNVLTLTGDTTVIDMAGSEKRPHVFQVKTASRGFCVSCYDKLHKVRWMEAVKEACVI